jgi:hypothetical protein
VRFQPIEIALDSRISNWQRSVSGCASRFTGAGIAVACRTVGVKAGQFVLHARALPGNPYDGHTLRGIIEETQRLIGRETSALMSTRDTAATTRKTRARQQMQPSFESAS